MFLARSRLWRCSPTKPGNVRLAAVVCWLCCCSSVGNERFETEVRLRLNGAVTDDVFVTVVGGLPELKRQVQSWPPFRSNVLHLGLGWWLADGRGMPVQSWQDVLALPPDLLSFSIVPEGRHFQWGVRTIHDRIKVPLRDREGVELEPIAKGPRVFVVHNLFSQEEADFLISNAENLEGEYALGKSGVGLETVGDRATDNTRTSESGFDVLSPTAVALSKRIFDLARVPWDDDRSDGLQILRYREGQAYVSHLDWFDAEDGGEGENLDTSTPEGTNRFATVVLYLQPPEEGGWTVFPRANIESDLVDTPTVSSGRNKEAAELFREQGRRLFPNENGWERDLVEECATRLSAKPVKLGAVLFYHQDPLTGELLHSAEHGGCPPFRGVKWAANMWIWNNKRALGSKAVAEGDGESGQHQHEPTAAVFHNVDGNGAQELQYSLDGGITWEHYDVVGPDEEKHVNTYPGHVWRHLHGGMEVKRWEIPHKLPDDSKQVRFGLVASGAGRQDL